MSFGTPTGSPPQVPKSPVPTSHGATNPSFSTIEYTRVHFLCPLLPLFKGSSRFLVKPGWALLAFIPDSFLTSLGRTTFHNSLGFFLNSEVFLPRPFLDFFATSSVELRPRAFVTPFLTASPMRLAAKLNFEFPMALLTVLVPTFCGGTQLTSQSCQEGI